MGASGLARPPLAQLLFVRIRFAPAHHPWGAHGRHFKNSAASKNQIYGIKNLVGTGRFEWARAGSRGRPSHSFCLCASASLLRITLGVLMVGTSKILPPPKIRFMG